MLLEAQVDRRNRAIGIGNVVDHEPADRSVAAAAPGESSIGRIVEAGALQISVVADLQLLQVLHSDEVAVPILVSDDADIELRAEGLEDEFRICLCIENAGAV